MLTATSRRRVQKVDAEMARWLRILDGTEPAFARAFLGSIKVGMDATTLRSIAEGYAAGNVAAVEARIAFREISEDLQRRLATVYPKAMERGAGLALTRMADPAMSFNVTDPWVQERMATGIGVLIKDIDEGTRSAVRQSVMAAYRDGLPPSAAAKQIKGVIGLTQSQEQAVRSFEAGLRQAIDEGLPASAVRSRWNLSRGIVRSDKALTGKNVPGMVAKYRDRMKAHRAMMIARTETAGAVTDGKFALWQQAQTEGLLPPTARVEWIVTPDERTCDICLPNHGEQVVMGQAFSSGDTRPPAHPMCRCDVRMVRFPKQRVRTEPRQRTDERIRGLQAARAARRGLRAPARRGASAARTTAPTLSGTAPDAALALDPAMKETILDTLAQTRWNIAEAARQMQINPSTLRARMKSFGITRPVTPKDLTMDALRRNGWNVSATAREMGINPSTLRARMKRWNIERPGVKPKPKPKPPVDHLAGFTEAQKDLLARLEMNGWNVSGTAKDMGINPSTLRARMKREGITREMGTKLTADQKRALLERAGGKPPPVPGPKGPPKGKKPWETVDSGVTWTEADSKRILEELRAARTRSMGAGAQADMARIRKDIERYWQEGRTAAARRLERRLGELERQYRQGRGGGSVSRDDAIDILTGGRKANKNIDIKMSSQAKAKYAEVEEQFRKLVPERYLREWSAPAKPARTTLNQQRGVRAYSSHDRIVLNSDFGYRSERTFIHEMGHQVENRSYVNQSARAGGGQVPNPVLNESRDFLLQRTKGEPVEELRKLTFNSGYGADELATRDRFKDAYVGKWYTLNDPRKGVSFNSIRATEVISMGLDSIWHDPIQFAKDDFGHFHLIMRLVRGAM